MKPWRAAGFLQWNCPVMAEKNLAKHLGYEQNQKRNIKNWIEYNILVNRQKNSGNASTWCDHTCAWLRFGHHVSAKEVHLFPSMNRILGPNDVILGHLCQHSDRVLSGWIFTNKNSHPFNALLWDAMDFCLEGKTGKIPKIPMFEKFPCLEGRNLEERKSIMNSHTWSFLNGFLFGWQKFPPQKKPGKIQKFHWNSILGEGVFPVRNLQFQALISRCEGRKVMVFLWKDDIFFLKLKVVCCICCWFKKKCSFKPMWKVVLTQEMVEIHGAPFHAWSDE